MNKERLERIAYLTVALIGIYIAAGIFRKYLLLPILPFLIAWAAAFALRPLAERISRRTRINKKAVSVTLAVITVSAGLFAIISLAVLLLDAAWRVLGTFLSDNTFADVIAAISEPLNALFGDAEGEVSEYIGESVKNALSKLLDGIISLLTGIVKGIPGVIFFILVTVIAAIYFCLDLDNVNKKVKSILPEKITKGIIRIKDGFFSVGFKYLRSYLFLMLITFFVMLAGFLILRVDGALALAATTALLDVLPLIGVGTILVPWGIICLILGNTGRGVGVLVLFCVHELIRQISEPKIVGENLGLHPILSLFLLYTGYKIFGFAGLFLTPIVSVILNVLREENDSSEVG